MAEVVLKIDGLDRLKKQFKKAPNLIHSELTRAVKNSVLIIRPLMIREAPVQTSKLRQNITASYSGLSGQVGPDLRAVPYAVYVHEGTSAHTIRPKNKKALYWKGALHPVKVVHHPGTKANKFVDRTADKATSPVNQIFQKAIDGILKTIAG